jgi:Fic family protein
MDEERFRKSPAGKLVRAGAGEERYWAFIPNPLPPDITWHDKLIQELSTADRALGELAGLGRTLPNPHLLVRPFIQREAVYSSRIEGTQADLGDIYSYQASQLPLPGIPGGESENDIREILNYVEALEHGLDRLVEFPLSLRLLRELHQRLMQGVRGEDRTVGHFRDRQNYISGRGDGIRNARYVPPPPEQLKPTLGQFEDYLHAGDTYPPVVRLALVHYQFEAIHPFIDGNGRIGRLLISLLTVHWKLLPLPLLYLSAYLEENRSQYYDLLLAVSERGAWGEWLGFFLRGVAEQSWDAAQRARALQDLQLRWHDRLSDQRSANTIRLADMLLASPILSIPDAQKMLDVTYNTARYNVEKLVSAGVLSKPKDSKYGKLFAAEEILEILT